VFEGSGGGCVGALASFMDAIGIQHLYLFSILDRSGWDSQAQVSARRMDASCNFRSNAIQPVLIQSIKCALLSLSTNSITDGAKGTSFLQPGKKIGHLIVRYKR